ncbi:amino acid synthesis family protein [Streptomyces sp. NRRL S-646]|uniref:amino acid synthesis family protein n=1 Tax=Streptomyces sp. NRRL S-646 TaxID=1463917 RepID=UPI001F1B7174|nr:amino acid synthesis family protein [Streptomyces sp. NRRL S-646]
MAVVAAVIENPWAGQGFVEDLTPHRGLDWGLWSLGRVGSSVGAVLAVQLSTPGRARRCSRVRVV